MSKQKLKNVLLYDVGPAITKCVLAICFRDVGLAADAGSDVLNLIRDKSTDAGFQRKTSRFFEEIGDQVAESLAPLFEFEAPQIDESSRIAVALAIAYTINSANINAATLAAASLDPNALYKQLLVYSPNATRDFEASLTDLYNRMLQQCCYSIVSVASTLPGFSEKVFAELFKKSEKILEGITRILDDINHIQEDVKRLNNNPDHARFERDYSNIIVSKLGKLELFGIDVSPTSQRYNLDTAYMTLRASWISGINVPLGGNNPVTKILSMSKHLLVRGEPGCGKSTLLQWIAVRAATRTFPDEMANWNGLVPFFVRLRQFVRRSLPSPEEFIQNFAPILSDRVPKDWLDDLLDSERAVLLIDGVDELPADKRNEVLSWLKDLITIYPGVRIIATSRPYAVSQSWLDREEFDCAEIERMEPGIVTEFVDRWHRAVNQELTDEGEGVELENCRVSIQNSIRTDRNINELATNPLLCAMLCALNRQRHRDLPRQRVYLYEAACRMLLEAREKRSGISNDDYPSIDFDELVNILQELAFWLFTNGYKQTEKNQVERIINEIRRSLQRLDKRIKTEDIYKLIVERSGIVREPQVGTLDFVHLSFQEYLTAKCAVEKENIGFIISHAHDPQWREVITLAAALSGEAARNQLILGIKHRGDVDRKERFPLYLLAMSCANSVIKLDIGLLKTIQELAQSMPPPHNEEQARSWAKGGQLAIPFLKVDFLIEREVDLAYAAMVKEDIRKKGKVQRETIKPSRSINDLPESTVASCVHALGLIAGEDSIEALKSYVLDTRFLVGEELGRNWRAFKRREYLEHILSKCKTLTLNQLPSPNEAAMLRSLISLRIESDNIDLAILSSLVNLETIELNGCTLLDDIEGIQELKSLQVVKLKYCSSIKSLTPLISLTRLREIELYNCECVLTLSPLAKCKALKQITIGGLGRTRRPRLGDLDFRKDVNINWDLSVPYLKNPTS